MSDLNYSHATWRIQVAKGVFVEINVKGCRSDSDVASPDDLQLAGVILRDLSRAVRRVRDRYAANVIDERGL